MRRVTEKLTMEECRKRALLYMLRVHDDAFSDAERVTSAEPLFSPSEVVLYGVWPESGMRAQGAGFIGGKILGGLKRDGLVRWEVRSHGVSKRGKPVESWGYSLTRQGQIEARKLGSAE